MPGRIFFPPAGSSGRKRQIRPEMELLLLLLLQLLQVLQLLLRLLPMPMRTHVPVLVVNGNPFRTPMP